MRIRASTFFEEKTNNLDLIRLGLAAAVIYSHAYPLSGNLGVDVVGRALRTTDAGKVAVQAFFLLSGYLILRSWLRNPSMSDYLRNRILRIYPGYLVAFAVSIVMGALLGGAAPMAFYHAIRSVSFETWLTTLQTVGQPPTLTGYTHEFANGVLNGAMWTLIYEFQCYLIVLAFGLLGLARSPLFSLLGFVGFLLADAGTQFSYSTPLQLFTAFFFGMVCYHLEATITLRLRFGIGLTAVEALLVALDRPWQLLLLPTLAFWLFYLGHSVKPARWLRADLSYGTYLYGWPVEIAVVHALGPQLLGAARPLLVTALTIVGALGAASLSWRFVELPALRLKRSAEPAHSYARAPRGNVRIAPGTRPLVVAGEGS